jgi:hypothetical protein
MIDLVGFTGLFLVAVIAGAINSVAGGGTLITFPSLVAFGETEIISNATNTAALWPGTLSSALGYKKDTFVNRGLLTLLLVPSLIGGLIGAFILVVTSERTFRLVVPCLILFTTLLFAARKTISRKLVIGSSERIVTTKTKIGGFFFQLFVAAYGGYFGAGIGILMLGSFSMMGLRDVHEMNAMKNALSTIINVTAFVFFAAKGLVVWPLMFLMALGAIVGGYVGARSAKRIKENYLHFFIMAIGLIISAWFVLRLFQQAT